MTDHFHYAIHVGKTPVFVDATLYELALSCGLIGRLELNSRLVPYIGNTQDNPVKIEEVFPDYRESEWYQKRGLPFAQYKEEKEHMSKMQEVLKRQEELRKELQALENEQFSKNLLFSKMLGGIQGTLENIQERLERMDEKNDATEPPAPPKPKRLSSYLQDLMAEPIEIRAKVYHYAQAPGAGIPMCPTEDYMLYIEKYDVPEFMTFLQNSPFRAIV